jgi:molecular chaperone DnaK
MKYYIGIDLGTTNSAICSYDGHNVRVCKSPEQNDVTPSAIFIDKRGNRYYGQKAYNQSPYDPDNSATLFKRFMGTSTKIKFESAKLSMTPEECSAEILKVLFGYLPEEIRNDPETATLITVPAAFNQMKKDATLQAAQLAGFARVALIQEPVAAVMSVMKSSKQEGIFLIYDLGGGTFDVSIAENIGGKVNLLAHGGKEMCGGRDLDRAIFNQLVVPWLYCNFDFPDDLLVNPKYKTLCKLAQWAAEQAKIELSANNDATIKMDERSLRCMDEKGDEVYIDIPISRPELDGIIDETVTETVEVTRDTLKKAGLSANDIVKIVFVGGPTNYKPLRDKLSFELSIPASIEVNPMTAVAEGASIFAESIDWSSERHNRKSNTAEGLAGQSITFRYTARTPDSSARVAFKINNDAGIAVEVTSIDSGWSSGRAALKNGMTLVLPLSKNGENVFDVVGYDTYGQALQLRENRIVITKTMAAISAIPASHSIFVEVLDKLGGTPVPDFLVKDGDALPMKGHKSFKAGQTLKAGSSKALNFKLWEGEIPNPISDNQFIGCYKICGTDFDDGIIPTGAEIECDYEMGDDGVIRLGASISCIGTDFGIKNFYSRKEGQIDLSDTDIISDDGQKITDRIEALSEKVDDPRLDRAREKAQKATSLGSETHDQEDTLKASEELLEAKKIVAQVGQEHNKEIRQMDLDSCADIFNKVVRQHAKPSQAEAFDNLTRAAQRSIDRNDPDFENQLLELKGKNFAILWRQDWFAIACFNRMVQHPFNYTDRSIFEDQIRAGKMYVKNDQIDELRDVLIKLSSIEITDSTGENMFDVVNIIRG